MQVQEPTTDLQRAEHDLTALLQRIALLRRATPPQPVKNYRFDALNGTVSLLDLFAGKQVLFVIHNMGQACRYCTLWADGLNGFVPHLEHQFALALVSKDSPEVQRTFANSRGWRFRMASHGGGDYIREQGTADDEGTCNMPGMVCYVREGSEIFRKNAAAFGPGDVFCAQWHILSLAGIGTDDWTPQYGYWQRPAKMDDGGENLL